GWNIPGKPIASAIAHAAIVAPPQAVHAYALRGQLKETHPNTPTQPDKPPPNKQTNAYPPPQQQKHTNKNNNQHQQQQKHHQHHNHKTPT
ncbi:hypothetical protein, partial [Mesorhizobium japonicum]|uniref:hypothetical protein n=1 Tax=Mesorhizobium japonicum TaxID=2066070 RepID=UPI003B5C7D41